MDSVKLGVKKLDPNAVIPSKAHPEDAGLDLTAVSSKIDKYGNYVYGFGLALEIPKGYVGLIFPRSSVYKQDISLANCVGVIDSNYRGEVRAMFKQAVINRLFAKDTNVYKVGERIAQLIIMPYPEVVVEEFDNLSESDRGEGGFGSTGK